LKGDWKMTKSRIVVKRIMRSLPRIGISISITVIPM
jgi:hypothetical protein